MKRKIETKYKLPLLNWVALPPTQLSGTVFTQLDDEAILKHLDFMDFEEVFRSNVPTVDTDSGMSLPCYQFSVKKPPAESLLQPNRSQNVAIARRKLNLTSEALKHAIVM